MMDLREIYRALRALDCAVTRGWPQALVPLPSISFSGCEDSELPDGSRKFIAELTARAASPEGADALAQQAGEIMAGLGLRRTRMKDGAEKDSDTFTKLLRYELREWSVPGEAPEAVIGGRAYRARLVSKTGERAIRILSTLADPAARPCPGPISPERMSLRLNPEACEDALAAFRGGEAVTVGGEEALIEGYLLDDGGLRLDLCLKGGG